MRTRQLDGLDKGTLATAYNRIEHSDSKRVSGSTVWNDLSVTGIAPVSISARLRRLVSLGLLEKDPANSSSRIKVYAPTEAGYKIWHQLKEELAA
jgi:DNA-binding MarR family transcriptional regulator